MPTFFVSPSLRTWAEIDLNALRHNPKAVQRRIGAGRRIIAVVKADAYGHGAVPVARAIRDEVAIFAVANTREACELLEAQIGRDLMLLSPCIPGERREVVEAGVIATVSSASEAAAFAAFGPVRVNFKVDTGMGRAGVCESRAAEELLTVKRTPGVVVHSISTHLPVADEDEPWTRKQLERFAGNLEHLRIIAPEAAVHSLNSAGVFRFPDDAGDYVRVGLALYGAGSVPETAGELRPALSWKARISLVKDLPAGRGVSYGSTFVATEPMKTAVVPVGYADGFPRQLSGRGAGVLIGGQWCPVLGRVTMDQIVVDLRSVPEAHEGDEVVLIGRQGNAEIAVEEFAERAGTIPWEIFTGLKERVVRLYSEPGVNVPLEK